MASNGLKIPRLLVNKLLEKELELEQQKEQQHQAGNHGQAVGEARSAHAWEGAVSPGRSSSRKNSQQGALSPKAPSEASGRQSREADAQRMQRAYIEKLSQGKWLNVPLKSPRSGTQSPRPTMSPRNINVFEHRQILEIEREMQEKERAAREAKQEVRSVF